MTLHEFRDDALRRFTRDLADQFFLYIENDRELFQEYLAVLGKGAGPDETNEALAQALKKYFNMNAQGDNHSPKSKLLVSYTEFINPVEEGLAQTRMDVE